MVQIAILLLSLSLSASAQSSSPKPGGTNPDRLKDEITVRGCVTKSSTDYILTQPDQGNSFNYKGPRN